MIDKDTFLGRMVELGGPTDRQASERALSAVVSAFFGALQPATRAALLNELPQAVRRGIQIEDDRADEDLVYERVQAITSVPLGRAREHAQIVMRALGEFLSDDVRIRVMDDLPASVSDLFRHQTVEQPPPHEVSGEGHTLATGKAGSRHPISEANADTTQTHSVAREKNPHGDTKLSSAHGLTQEDAGESLATSRPDERRKISKAGG
jgi:uncharacterized protein (DUF2267 family)